MFIAYSTNNYHFFNSGLGEMMIWSSMILIIMIPFSVLFFNHLAFAKQVELAFHDKTFQYTNGQESCLIDLADIKEVTEYAASKMPYGFVIKWVIETDERNFTVSNLVIPHSTIQYYFWNKMKYNFDFFPTV